MTAMTQLSWYGSSESVEWYTPTTILDRVVSVLGAIDLDPCSNPPPYNVPARMHMTERDDGLTQRWSPRVYLNPPYGRELPRWMAKLAWEIEQSRVKEAITLTPARPDTEWFRMLWHADALCFWYGRIKSDDWQNPTYPSVVGYFGRRRKRFAAVFGEVGKIVYPKVGAA